MKIETYREQLSQLRDAAEWLDKHGVASKIGRASCRERVYVLV